jgi:hypothetical protein
MISLDEGVDMYTENFEKSSDMVIFDHPKEGLAVLVRRPEYLDNRHRKFAQIRFPIGLAVLGDLLVRGVLSPLAESATRVEFNKMGILVKVPQDVDPVDLADLSRAFEFLKSLGER